MQQPTLALSVPESTGIVPLRDWTAASLMDIVSSAERNERLRLLRHLLTVDPAMLLWTALCRGDEVRAWRDVTTDELAEWVNDRLETLLLRCETTVPPMTGYGARIFDAQISTITVARSAVSSLNGTAAEIGATVYSGSLLAFARDWLYTPDGQPTGQSSSKLPDWIPGWLHLLLTESKSKQPPSIEFIKPIRSAIHNCESNLGNYVGDLERQQWRSEFPIIRSVFAKNVQHLRRLESRKQSEASRLESEKLAAMKELAYGASHEINNPLANISTRAQLLMRDEENADRKRQLATITRQAYRAHEMISDLMLFAKPPRLQLSRFSVSQFFDDLARSLQDDTELNAADVTFSIRDDIEMEADSQQLKTALRAIIKNSIEASDTTCSVTIACTLREISDPLVPSDGNQQHGPMAEIRVTDNGSGISPDVRRHLFDPFYSGREAGRGLGFGLSKAWRIVEQHGGEIVVDSPSRGGTTMVLRIPIPAEKR